jgi:hypothetical protein
MNSQYLEKVSSSIQIDEFDLLSNLYDVGGLYVTVNEAVAVDESECRGYLLCDALDFIPFSSYE